MMFSNANETDQCMEIVRKELIQKNLPVNNDILRKIAEDIMSIIYAKGGGYSVDMVQSFTGAYVEKELYKEYLDK